MKQLVLHWKNRAVTKVLKTIENTPVDTKKDSSLHKPWWLLDGAEEMQSCSFFIVSRFSLLFSPETINNICD